MRTVVMTLIVLAGMATANAAFNVYELGATRVTQLGGYVLTQFGPDSSPVYQEVSYVNSPLGGILDFDVPDTLEHRNILDGSWATWSGSYTGDVYFENGVTSITLDLPADTRAFVFYAQPVGFGDYDITAFIPGGPSITQYNVSGAAGAVGFGFLATGSDYLDLITIQSSAAFGIGEFAIAVPAPGALLLGALGSALAIRMRRKMAR